MTPAPDDPRDLLQAAIRRSGLSARKWAETVALRDERTVRRWVSGKSPIPQAVIAWLEQQGCPERHTD